MSTQEETGSTAEAPADCTSASRRDFLATAGKVAVAGAAVLAAPAIIGRARLASAAQAFAGESLIVVSWSGNYELVFREQVVQPFNEKYGTKVETVGGWDQIVTQIQAAPADNPPFDLTVGEEYVSSAGLADHLYLKTDRAKIPNLEAVYPWFYAMRSQAAGEFGIPFGGGTCMLLMRKRLGIPADSWKLLWDDRLAGKVTADSGAWWWTLSIPAVISTAAPALEEMYEQSSAEVLMQELEKLKIAKWFKDGAEQANILNQDEADAAMSYSSDALTFMDQAPGEYEAAVPKEGTSAWTDWYFKVRGTKHSDLADLFANYMLEKATQERFLSKSLIFVSRRDVVPPAHWHGYPKSNEDFARMFQIVTMEGWDKMNANYQWYDDRFKQVVKKTSA